jgi:hypothetical protein
VDFEFLVQMRCSILGFVFGQYVRPCSSWKLSSFRNYSQQLATIPTFCPLLHKSFVNDVHSWRPITNYRPLCFSPNKSATWLTGGRQSLSSAPIDPQKDVSGRTMEARDSGLNTTSYKEKLKFLLKKYGWFLILTHFSIYFTVLGGMYLAVAQGIDMVGLLRKIGVDKWIDISKLDSAASKLVLAFLLTKLTGPIRIPITITLTPLVARTFRMQMSRRHS